MRHAEVTAEWIELEPGDGTHYEFLVSEIPEEVRPTDRSIFIASVSRGSGCPIFVGYAYSIESLINFRERFPQTFTADRDHYQRAAVNEGALHDFFVGYIREHSGTHRDPPNPWTCLAAIRAALLYLFPLGVDA